MFQGHQEVILKILLLFCFVFKIYSLWGKKCVIRVSSVRVTKKKKTDKNDCSLKGLFMSLDFDWFNKIHYKVEAMKLGEMWNQK